MRETALRRTASRAFTLVELLIVVAIIGVLAAIAVVNLRQATERALKSADAGNLHTIATALQSYYVDYGTLPPADAEAGPFMSHTEEYGAVGNGPAGGGSLDGLPWLLYEKGYVSNWETLFCPKYLRRYRGGETISGGWPRYHNFRYAYNSASAAHGGHAGGQGDVMSGETWIVRDLGLAPEFGWYGASWPEYPADYDFPWGEGEHENARELALFADMAVVLVEGRTGERVR